MRVSSLLLPLALVAVVAALWVLTRTPEPETRPDLAVRVIDDRGDAVPHYTLLVRPRFDNHAREGEEPPQTLTREVDALDGVTTFQHLASGPWTLRVDRTDDALRWSEDVEVVLPSARPTLIVVPRNGRLTGIVRDAAREPVADARVDVYVRRGVRGTRASVTSGADGRFVLDPAPSGSLDVVVHADDWSPAARTVVVPPGGSLEVELGDPGAKPELSLATPDVFGRVVDDLGRPVEGYWLVVLPDAAARGVQSLAELPESVVESYTRADGRFALHGIEPGAWRGEVDSIFGDAASRFRWSEPVAVDLPRAEPLELVVPRDGRLEGTVLDPDGAPLPGAEVSVRLRRGRKSAGDIAVSDADGRFVLDPAPAGSLELTVRAAGRLDSAQPALSLAPGEVLDAPLRMRAGATIEGRGREPSAWYLLQRSGTNGLLRLPTDERGSFLARFLEPGHWMVVAGSGEGHGLAPRPVIGQGRRTISVQEGEVARLDMAPPPRHTLELEGRVSHRGAPVAEVFVSCNPLAAESFPSSSWRSHGAHAESIHHDTWCLTDADGRFRLVLEQAGPQRLWVGASGSRVLWRIDLPVQDGGGLELALPTGRLAGHVIDRGGTPQAGLALTLDTELRFDEGGAETPTRLTVTDSRGAFDFTHLVGADYLLRTVATEDPRPSGQLVVQVIDGETTEVFLEVE